MTATVMRGGTSRGVFLLESDLAPIPTARRHALYSALIGGSDPAQIDGLGGGITSTSKLMVVSPAAPEDAAAVSYRFFQVAVADGAVDSVGNCGNLTPAVAQFAVDSGLAHPGPDGTVRMRNVNTDRLIEVGGPVSGRIGSEVAVHTTFASPAGAQLDEGLLPSGAATEVVRLRDREVEVSIVDCSSAYVFARAEDFGITGEESVAELNADADRVRRARELIAAAADRCPSSDRGALHRLGLISGAGASEVSVRMMNGGVFHHACPVTGAIALAAARRIPGTIVHNDEAGNDVQVVHPKGSISLSVDVATTPEFSIRNVRVHSTVRTIMRGTAYVDLGADA